MFRLEPLALRVNQADKRDRRLADEGGQHREVVERLLRLGIKDLVAVQSGQPGNLK